MIRRLAYVFCLLALSGCFYGGATTTTQQSSYSEPPPPPEPKPEVQPLSLRNPDIDEAQQALSRAEQNSTVATQLPLDLERARAPLNEAEAIWKREKGSLKPGDEEWQQIQHLAYIARQRAAIAEAKARSINALRGQPSVPPQRQSMLAPPPIAYIPPPISRPQADAASPAPRSPANFTPQPTQSPPPVVASALPPAPPPATYTAPPVRKPPPPPVVASAPPPAPPPATYVAPPDRKPPPPPVVANAPPPAPPPATRPTPPPYQPRIANKSTEETHPPVTASAPVQARVSPLPPAPVPAQAPSPPPVEAMGPAPEDMPGSLNPLDPRSSGRGVVLTFGDEYFVANSTLLKSSTRALLDSLVQYLSAHPGMPVICEGYSNTSPFGGEPQIFAEGRARSVQEALFGRGVGFTRISIVGYGSAPGGANRRVDVVIKKASASPSA